ncbi:hypothetical protein HCZ30_06585 [Marivivens donghaensis]|uniref:Uncharacterized protein n=2 Tax=Marivivens donghaensis TaxID=1699413 RepID=A0ABX0VYU0_9RHOB|nr:hypothetical protein [Marivivens donghaensis]
MVVLPLASHAQTVTPFGICSDISQPFEDQVAAMEAAGFSQVDEPTAEMAKVTEAHRVVNNTWSTDNIIEFIEAGDFAEAFEPFPGFIRETIYWTHPTGAAATQERESGPFVGDSIDMVVRSCLIMWPDDYSGDTGLMALTETPETKMKDLGQILAFRGERDAPLAQVSPVDGSQIADFGATIIAYTPDLDLGLPATSVELRFTEYRDPLN